MLMVLFVTYKGRSKRFASRYVRLKNFFNICQSKKLQQFTKLCKGDMSQNLKTAKMVLGRYYRVLNSRLALTTYTTSHFKYLKNITVYPKQNFVVDTFTMCQAKLSESRFRFHIALT